VQVPSDQSIVRRSVEKSEGKTGNGNPEPDMIENVGPVLNFENKYLWSLDKLLSLKTGGKADVFQPTEGSSPSSAMASKGGTTVVLDQGMHSKG
jgi:hypothetical protein